MENQKFFFKDDTSSHDNFFTTKGKKGVLFIPPKYLKEGIKYARENNMRAIRISPGIYADELDTPPVDLEFQAFDYFCELDFLHIDNNFNIGKVSGIDSLYNLNIRKLILEKNINFSLDFEKFKHLEHLYVTETSRLSLFRFPSSLKELCITNFKSLDLSKLSTLINLLRLELRKSKIISLQGLESCRKLEKLIIFSAPSLQDISVINQLKIKYLRLEKCPKLNIESISQIYSNSLLDMSLFMKIENLNFLSNYPNLEKLFFSEVTDGNLNPILDSSLKYISFSSDKKHYSHKMKQLNDLLTR